MKSLHLCVIILGMIILLSRLCYAWECTKPGRFRDPEEGEESCNLYVTCIPDGEGSFALRNDQCSSGNLFSEKYQRCISGESCDSLEDFYSIEYDCKECGKFVNVKSQDCRQFVNCLKTKDPGVFVPIKQNCPKDQVFSAKTLTCVDESDYQCPPTVLKFLSDFVCLGVGQYPDESVPNCRGYRLCSRSKNGSLVSENFLCENDTIYSETDKNCVSPEDYDCPDDGTDDFECPGVGRYPDKVSKTCETYHNCVENSRAELKATLSTCPGGTIFSAITSKCVSASEYVCPTALAELELFEQQSVNEPSIARRIANEAEINDCAESGRFANNNDQLCKTYYLCSRDPEGNWFKQLVRCPTGTVFSPEQKRCLGNTEDVCPTLTTVEQPTTPTSTTGELLPAECVGAGRSPNPEDEACKTFYLCSLNSYNELVRALFRCPEGSVFSTETNKCVKNDGTFECGRVSESSTEDSFDQSGDGLSPTSPIQTSDLESTDVTETVPITIEAETVNTVVTVATVSYEYPCTATGRFADINSIDCRSYFLCAEDDSGSIISTHLHCPSGMVFSRNNNKCVASTRNFC
ncbi:uncharacterized protein LOC134206696 [Armigeres subalbatus]|uniref:uncharacterized protein LOC134206696 n=1 Tax=Armigeres subalbatus TaxID=124917 RepID=UPI002ED0D2D7